MKTKVITIPKGKCPLDILAQLGNKTKSSWIFFHSNVMEELIGHLKNDFEVEEYTRKHIQIKWAKSDKYPETYIKCIPYYSTEWTSVSRIEAEDIAFKTPSANPSYIFFVKMEE